MLSVFGAFAEFERNIINERREEGIAVARAQGKKIGRPSATYPKNWKEVIASWQSGDLSAVEAMKSLSLSKPTFYRLVKKSGISLEKAIA
jgi:DNA invertase Pin-like site-specific DNA recombinase